MEENLKQLLLQDLCARLPYGVRVCVDESGLFIPTLTYIESAIICHFKECAWTIYIDNIKPYLRPLSSMTENEINEYENFITNEKDDQLRFCNELVFYNRHHFDYRGLIPKGLALEAKEGMYNFK